MHLSVELYRELLEENDIERGILNAALDILKGPPKP
jgi:hypothetical protein